MADKVPMKSDRGKEILAHAMAQDRCVLEFKQQDDGTHVIMDITDHVEALETKTNNA
jgi:hypothetical protein